MSDEDYVPPSGTESDDSVSMDEVAASGDDEVVAAALQSGQSDSPRRRRPKRRRRTVSPTVPCQLVGIDTSPGQDPSHNFFKTFRGVWEDVFSWEECRSRKPRFRKVRAPPKPPHSPANSPPPASSSTPVPPASPIPSSFSSGGSIVEVPVAWASCASLEPFCTLWS